MNADPQALQSLLVHFASLSFVAFGGGNAVLPEMHRMVVDEAHWMSSGDFSELFAIAQAAPGPNILMVTLIGWKVAGLKGALVATLAMIGPSSVLAFSVSKIWKRFEKTRFIKALVDGIVPITLGFITASGLLLARAADKGPSLFMVTGFAAVLVFFSRLNPLWILGAAALLGAAGAIS